MSSCNTATYKRLQRPLFRTCSYTAHAIKQCTRLYRRFSGYLPYSTAANNRPTQAAITLPAPRWSVSQRRSTSSTYQIPPPRRTLCRSAQPPYYNKVYKEGAVQHTANRACGGVSILPTPGGLRIWHRSAVSAHPPPGRAVQQPGRGGRRGTIDGYRRISFRAFAR